MERFAHGLRELRTAAGAPTYRVMGGRAGYSASTLAAAARGDELPSLPLALAYVKVCGGNPEEWEARWRKVARAVAEQSVSVVDDGAAAEAPYRGLARYEPGDRNLFFGREQVLSRLTGLLAAHRVVLLAGASGSGKSSLLRAGLIPVLRDPENPPIPCAAIRIITPGPQPIATHTHALTPAPRSGEAGTATCSTGTGLPRRGTAAAGDPDTIVVVDQFEEIFTLCQDTDERTRFINLLLAARTPDSGLRVVIGVRADFYAQCTEHPGLVEVLREAHLALGPMTPAELRQAVIGPARAAGLISERELTARIVQDTTAEPGGLPLMSHALLEIWRRRRGRTLTLAAYEAIGGIHGAVADTAEHTYQQLTAAQAVQARRVLLRLITPGQGSQDTRRPAPRAEIEAMDPDDAAAVLESLARARLVTLDEDTADLAHEALITAWPRLRAWIDEERTRLVLHRQLSADAETWTELDHDPGSLYRGTRLAAVQDAFPHPHDYLTPVEQAFLTAATTAQEHEQQAQRRTARRQRRFTAVLAVLLVLALGSGAFAWQESRTSARERDLAHSRQLAATSLSMLESNPEQAALLALQAHHIAPTTEAVGSLYRAAALPHRSHRWDSLRVARKDLHRSANSERATAFSPDLRSLASAYDGRKTVLLDLVDGDKTLSHPVGQGSQTATALAFSPDGRVIAGSVGRTVSLRDADSGRLQVTLSGHRAEVTALTYSSDGRLLATGDSHGGVRLWNTRTGRVQEALTGHTGAIHGLAFSPDGTALATGARDGTVRVWNTVTGSHSVLTRAAQRINRTGEGPRGSRLPAHASLLSFHPDGKTLAVSHDDGTVRLWSLATRTSSRTLTGHRGQVRRVEFSPDGRTLATTDDQDKTIRMWGVAEGRVHTTLAGHSDLVTAMAFSKDSTTLVTAGREGTIRQWAVSHPLRHSLTSTQAGGITSLAVAHDGKTLATASTTRWNTTTPFADHMTAHTIRVWNLPSRSLRLTLTGDTGRFALSPDGTTIATSNADGTIRLRDTRSGLSRLTLRRESKETGTGKSAFYPLGFSRDGSILATSGQERRTTLWNIATGEKLRTVTGITHKNVLPLAFSPNGSTWLGARESTVPVDIDEVATSRILNLVPFRPDIDRLPLSPDLSTFAFGGTTDGTVRLINAATGEEKRTITSPDGTVTAVAFSPDSRTLATTGSSSPRIHLWDVETGALRQTLAGEEAGRRYLSLAFSPDNTTLTAATTSGTIDFWNTDLPDKRDAIARLCRALRDTASRESHNPPDGCPRQSGTR
ncbi:nSTAND1 domain-containing NTPase [Streptomyces tsukubensis]